MGDAHDAAEWAEGEDGGSERGGDVAGESPVKEAVLFGKALVLIYIQEAETGYGAGPAPAFVFDGEDFYFEDIAGFGSVNGDGAGEGVDAVAVDGEEVFNGE